MLRKLSRLDAGEDRSRRHKSGTMRVPLRKPLSADHDLRESEAWMDAARDKERCVAELLSNADRMASLGTLAAGVAHEINNPLTYVLVNVEHVLRRMRAEMAAAGPGSVATLNAHIAALSAAIEGGNRVREIVRDLMTFACGNVDQRGLVDVRRTIESALRMAGHELKHRATVDKRLREVPPVLANEARLAHVFLTLLVNAAQAIPEGNASHHRVSIDVSAAEDGWVVVDLTDTGVGIPPDVVTRVFDPFFTTKEGHATGMSLAVAHGTIRALGGDLTVESEVGKGSTFRVLLPVAQGFATPPKGHASQSAIAPPRHVLVIEDDANVLEALRLSLADEHRVATAPNARCALDSIVSGERYDIILCDLMMPEMTGMDFYREVLRLAPAMASRIVFLTGGTFTDAARDFVEAVPNRCLEKPPDMSKLRELVRKRRT